MTWFVFLHSKHAYSLTNSQYYGGFFISFSMSSHILLPVSVSRLLTSLYHKVFVHFYKCTIDSSNHDLRLTFVRVQPLIYKVCRLSGKSVTSYIKISEGNPTNAYLTPYLFEYYITVQTRKCYYSE